MIIKRRFLYGLLSTVAVFFVCAQGAQKNPATVTRLVHPLVGSSFKTSISDPNAFVEWGVGSKKLVPGQLLVLRNNNSNALHNSLSIVQFECCIDMAKLPVENFLVNESGRLVTIGYCRKEFRVVTEVDRMLHRGLKTVPQWVVIVKKSEQYVAEIVSQNRLGIITFLHNDHGQ